MNILQTEFTNQVLTAEGCFDLPVVRDVEQETTTSYWQPTAEEVALLVAGVPIALTIFGLWHPPVQNSVGE